MTLRFCEVCKTELMSYSKKRFCSRSCANEGQKIALADKFWARVNKTDGCWLWTGAVFQESKYGQLTLRISGKPTPRGAHRISWELHFGPIPDGLFVLHNCPGGDNKLCVRPDHLFLGTHADNMADMVAKGRSATGDRNAARLYPETRPKGEESWSFKNKHRLARGERNGTAKLTETIVREIRSRFGSPGLTVSAMAKEYGVSRTLIRNIAKRRIWAHVI